MIIHITAVVYEQHRIVRNCIELAEILLIYNLNNIFI